MKKSLLALAALAGISMLFMGCPKTTGNNETPADNTPAEETPTTGAASWYSYKVKTTDGTTYLFNEDGTLKSEGEQSVADLLFVKFTLAANNLWTSFYAGTIESYDADLASYCTYSITDGTLKLELNGTECITCTASGDYYTATYASAEYTFVKVGGTVPADETPAGPTSVQVIELKKFIKWSDLIVLQIMQVIIFLRQLTL